MPRSTSLSVLSLLSATLICLSTSIQAQETDELEGLKAQLERLKREKETLQQQVSESQAASQEETENESSDPFAQFFENSEGGSHEGASQTSPSGAPNFEDFGRADIIQLLHSGQIAPLEASPLRSLVYISNLSSKLSDQSTLFLIEDPSVILMTVDPTVSTRASQKLAASQKGMRELNSAATQNLFGMLGAIADTRRDGGSIDAEIQGMYSAAANSPTAQLNMLKQQAEFDAIKLAYLSQTHPEDFKKIYRSIRKFIRS